MNKINHYPLDNNLISCGCYPIDIKFLLILFLIQLSLGSSLLEIWGQINGKLMLPEAY